MTMRYARAAFYTCDRCNVEGDGWDTKLPDGWVVESAVIAGAVTHITRHLCPKCAPPIAQRPFMNTEPSNGEAA